MRFIGITGGVGAGKSEVLKYLASLDGVRVMLSDEIAHDLMEPGTDCYRKLKETFPDADLYLENGAFNRPALAAFIFKDADRRTRLNAIVHPAVKNYVKEEAARERAKGKLQLLVLEAALLIEEHYDEICDELWYIYVSEDNRRSRLKASRSYPDAKIDAIFRSQLPEEAFRAACTETIDNNGSVVETIARIRELLLARQITVEI